MHGSGSVIGSILDSAAGASKLQIMLPSGTCNINIGEEDSVVCYDCKVGTHAAQICSGLPPKDFKAAVEFEEFRIIYICTPCHSKKDNSNDNSSKAYKLFDTMKALSNSVQTHSDEFKQLKTIYVAP